MDSALKLFLLSCMTSLALSTNCPYDEWMAFQGHWYRLYTDPVPWKTARANCEGQGGYIVSINSECENEFVSRFTACFTDNQGPRTWLGSGPDYWGQDPKVWLDGAEMTYFAWDEGKPNNWGGNEGCIEINYSVADVWNDDNCIAKKQYICEKEGL